MVIAGRIYECDFTGNKYPEGVQGGEVVVKGATGRHCVVMHAGPEYLAETKWEVLDAEATEAARERVAAEYGWGAVEF